MTSVYNGLSATKKSQSLFTAVDYSTSGTSFCKGAFPAIHSSSWYNGGWGVNQRDVVILYDNCGAWKVYCKFSMNTNTQNDFAAVLDTALSLATSCSSTPPTPTSPTPSTPAPTLAPGSTGSPTASPPTSLPTDKPSSSATTAGRGTTAVSGVVTMDGVDLASFDTAAQVSFRELMAAKAGVSCGASGATACTQADVTLVTVSRRSVRVAFTIATGPAAATATSQLISSYLQGSSFPTDLATKDSRLASITVTSAAVSAQGETSGSAMLYNGALLCSSLFAIIALIQRTTSV